MSAPKFDRKPRGTFAAGLFLALAAGSALLILAAAPVHADCRLELELIGTDLKGIVLTEEQKLRMAPMVDDASKRCRLGREEAALQFLDKARAVAGITRKPDELDLPASSGAPAR